MRCLTLIRMRFMYRGFRSSSLVIETADNYTQSDLVHVNGIYHMMQDYENLLDSEL